MCSCPVASRLPDSLSRGASLPADAGTAGRRRRWPAGPFVWMLGCSCLLPVSSRVQLTPVTHVSGRSESRGAPLPVRCPSCSVRRASGAGQVSRATPYSEGIAPSFAVFPVVRWMCRGDAGSPSDMLSPDGGQLRPGGVTVATVPSCFW